MTIVRVIIYDVLLVAFYFACARLYNTINKLKSPAIRDKSLPIAKMALNGKDAVKVACLGMGTKKDWHMQREPMSPCYTTRFNDLLKVNFTFWLSSCENKSSILYF